MAKAMTKSQIAGHLAPSLYAAWHREEEVVPIVCTI